MGGFAVYRTQPAVFDLLAPRFGDLSKRKNLIKLLPVWFRSYQYRISGLDRGSLEKKILAECHSNGDFLRIVMDEITLRQGAERWAVWGPDNLLYMPEIARTVPGALFVHMIRDGRDVALSLSKEGWIRPFPWDRGRRLQVAALHWRWKVERGRQFGREIQHRYLEVSFEDFVSSPAKTLADLSKFLDHDLNYERIQQQPIGTVMESNSTFIGADGTPTSSPVGRWKTLLSAPEVVQIESVTGPLLQELGYPLQFPEAHRKELRTKAMAQVYPAFFDLKEWMKANTPMAKLVDTSRLRFDDAVPQ